jgi:hypothetical protein
MVCNGSFMGFLAVHVCGVVQAERISRLEAQRAQLLEQLPSSVAAHVVKRQQDAVEEEGECGGGRHRVCVQGCCC